jgi:hypothetical protein
MSKTELMTAAASATDGITGHTDEVAGQEKKKSGLFRGARIKFSKVGEWEIDGEAIDPETRLILIDVTRIVTRWGPDKKPLETIALEPGEKWPDHEAWNDALPRTEWIQGMNGPQGPWRPQQIVYVLDPKSMAQYHWADGTVGGSIAISEAVNSIRAMRRFRPGAAPVVGLASKFMNTKFGGRQRPHFVIHNWVTMPGEEPQPTALPAPAAEPANSAVMEGPPIIEARSVVKAAPVIEGKAGPVKEPAVKLAKKSAKRIGTLDVTAALTPIKPVSISEELNDEIPI